MRSVIVIFVVNKSAWSSSISLLLVSVVPFLFERERDGFLMVGVLFLCKRPSTQLGANILFYCAYDVLAHCTVQHFVMAGRAPFVEEARRVLVL